VVSVVVVSAAAVVAVTGEQAIAAEQYFAHF
jgi:hypothetical protein